MAGARGLALKRPSALPGFGLALGFTLTYLSLIVLIPLAALAVKAASLGASGFWDAVTAPRTLAALRVSFVISAIAAAVNVEKTHVRRATSASNGDPIGRVAFNGDDIADHERGRAVGRVPHRVQRYRAACQGRVERDRRRTRVEIRYIDRFTQTQITGAIIPVILVVGYRNHHR